MACKFGILEDLKDELGKSCDFLNPEIQNESVLNMMKDVLTLIQNNFSSGFSWLELKAIVMEMLLRCVGSLVSCGSSSAQTSTFHIEPH